MKPDGTLGFCERCLRTFVDLVEGTSPTDFHRKIKALVCTSPKCRRCYESYVQTGQYCQEVVRGSTPTEGQRQELLAKLRAELVRRDNSR